MYTSFLLVAKESADGMVKMRGWKRKGRYPLVSKKKDRATRHRAGETGVGVKGGCIDRSGLEKTAWEHTR